MKSKYKFIIKWERGSINSNIVSFLKENNISFCYDHFGRLIADLYGIGQMFSFDYEQIKENVFGIIANPVYLKLNS